MNDRNWTLLLEAIQERKVVLIVGDNLFHMASSQETNVKDYLLNSLNDKFAQNQIRAENLTELNEYIIDYNYLNRRKGDITNIYYEINQILKSSDITCHPSLKQLVKSGYFPLILSTSIIPGVGNILGIDSSYVYSYRKTECSDINVEMLDPSFPTLYHLFGKASALAKSYMVTEDDLLDYMHYWHDSKTRPTNISNYLAGKYILVLGCDYPNWLFRFFWHSIKNFDISSSATEYTGIVSVESENDDKDLRNFLYRIQTDVCQDASSFLGELVLKLNELDHVDEKENDSDVHQDDIDFFISYASEDLNIADNIAQVFKEYGAENVWFDKKRLRAGNDYDRVIKKSIMKAKRFVPILSQNTLVAEGRYFRKEWCLAEDARMINYPKEYIVPIIIDDCDVYSDAFPETFAKAHCIHVSSPEFKLSIKELIRSIRR